MTVDQVRRRQRRSDDAPVPSGDNCSDEPSPAGLSASSSPLLLRLAHRHDCSKAGRRVSPSLIVMSLLALLIVALFSSSASAEFDSSNEAVPDGVFLEESQTVTISPTSCPASCTCFFTLMYCYDVPRIPAVISPATRFVHISSTQFVNPVLTRANFSSGYENVEDIAIQYTNLATIQNQAFDNLRRVRYISLDHNQLTTLPSSMLRVFARAKFISLFSNQWTCNKDLAWLYEVYRSNPDKFGAGCLDWDCRFVSQLRCNAPSAFRNLDFVNITFTQYQQMQTAN